MAIRSKAKTPQALNQTRAIGYLRLSPGTRKSSRSGNNEDAAGRDAQLGDIMRWAAQHETEVVRVLEDIDTCGEASDIDEPLSDRPGLLEAIALLRQLDCGVLVVQKGDRLARDLMLAPMVRRLVKREGAEVVNANGIGNGDSPEALIMRTIDDMLNAIELVRIRQRTKAALAVKRQRGERVGQIPYGYRLKQDKMHRTTQGTNDKHPRTCKGCLNLEQDPTEYPTIGYIQWMRSEGLSIAYITERLNTENHPCRGSRWHTSTVWRILERTK